MQGFFRFAPIAVLVLTLSACAAQYRNHGYVPSEDELAQITVGVDTRDTVASLVGSPSSVGVLSDSGYYYVRTRLRQFGPQKPEVVNRQVVAISFTDAGIVENIGRYTLEDGLVVPLARRITRNGQDVNFIRKLLGTIGGFNPAGVLN
jgi:outer membrane protein assembly factor BamE (lipoprotein component of BamABCDE complex)